MRNFIVLICFVFSAYSIEYEFNSPQFSTNDTGPIFQYFLPQKDGFTPNINLVAQSYSGTLEEYDELSRNQFKQMGFEILKSEHRPKELFYEYRGQMQGLKLHWYARAIKDKLNIYLITATYLQSHSKSDGKKLNEAVDSFKLKKN